AAADTAGGAGGRANLEGGAGAAGGTHTANNPDGGAGGDVLLTPGAGGAAGGGTGAAGAPGKVDVGSGRVQFADAQTLGMNDVTVQLTVDPVALVGTLLTSNVMYVDAESGSTEDLELPPEASCNGLVLFIVNTGGESIVVKDDAAGYTVVTIATGKAAIVCCDGTTWDTVSLVA
ncbi:MAG: hypothetical protein ACTSX8_10650, partial [Alphaproteobacteria bacterium]